MMLMAKFGKFKLRLMAAIHMSALLAIFNVAASSSNYWLKYIEPSTQLTHFAGLWRSCPNQGVCMWKSGIVSGTHTVWSYLVRIFIGCGTLGNILAVLIYFMAFIYKLNKKTKCVVRLLEIGNIFVMISFVSIMAGFCMFISNSCNYSIWLHCISMVFVFFASNLLTRYFAQFYFLNCRAGTKLCSTGAATAINNEEEDDDDDISRSKVQDTTANDEEKIALAPIQKDAITSTEIDMKPTTKTETHGSNEALIVQPLPTMEVVTSTTATTTTESA